jgi:hypothetical protein
MIDGVSASSIILARRSNMEDYCSKKSFTEF